MVENSEKPKRKQKSVHEKHNLHWLLTPGCDFEFLAPCSLEACAIRLTSLSDPHFLGFVIGNTGVRIKSTGKRDQRMFTIEYCFEQKLRFRRPQNRWLWGDGTLLFWSQSETLVRGRIYVPPFEWFAMLYIAFMATFFTAVVTLLGLFVSAFFFLAYLLLVLAGQGVYQQWLTTLEYRQDVVDMLRAKLGSTAPLDIN